MFLSPVSRLGSGLASISLYGGLLLFSGFLLYDTQHVIRRAESHPPPNFYLPTNKGFQNPEVLKPFDPINKLVIFYAILSLNRELFLFLRDALRSKVTVVCI